MTPLDLRTSVHSAPRDGVAAFFGVVRGITVLPSGIEYQVQDYATGRVFARDRADLRLIDERAPA